MEKLTLHNTLTRKKELFVPIHKDHVGMYVCGPTVYGNAHLGHARPAITFDLLFRYLLHIGYKVRYVRNITDVGHLVNDADEGEDKVAKKAKVEELEPMEIVQIYTNSYRKNMGQLNVLPPSIEPTASGHIIEQIEAIKKMLETGFAYEINGSVYFDVKPMPKNILTGYFPAEKLRISIPIPAIWMVRTRRDQVWILRYGKMPCPNISCAGPRPGVSVSRDGTPNVRP